MKKVMILSAACLLAGCYGYKTVRTIKPGGKECSYEVGKRGNSVVGYDESDFTNERRAETECREWLKEKI